MPVPTHNQITNQQPNSPLVQSQNGAQQSTPLAIPFGRSAKKSTIQGQTQVLASNAWAASSTQVFTVPTSGFLSTLWLTLTGSGGAKGASTVVAPSPDAAWSLLSNASLVDVGGNPFWNLPGYSSFLARLFGGYRDYRPDQSAFGYTPVDGTANGGAGTGNFKIKYEFPIEFATDGLGCLPNMDGSAQYRLNLTYNGPSVFYNGAGQQPGTLPSISALLELGYRNRPAPADNQGRPQAQQPPASGTVPFWTSQTFNVLNGQNTIQLTRVSNVVRNQILVFRDANGSRANADSTGVTPTVIEYDRDSSIRYKQNIDTLRQDNYETYGFDNPAGVVVFQNISDNTGRIGAETGQAWIDTVGSTLLQLQFVSSAAGTLEVITNDFVPGSGSVYTAPLQALMGG